jgi:hypothetical protein
MSALDPLDPELVALFERERAEHRPEAMARDEVLVRAERAIRLAALVPAPGAPAPPAPAPLPGPSGLLGGAPAKIMLALALAGAFGGGVVVGRASAPTTVVTGPMPAPSGLATSASAGPPPRAAEAGAPSIEASALPAAPTSASSAVAPRPRPSDGVSDLAKEQELVDTARGALARGRGAEAFAATEQHASRFPAGALAEERDALAVQALALDGRADEAKSRADRFAKKYPRSIFRAAVERAVSKP